MEFNSKKFQAIRFAELFSSLYYGKGTNPEHDDDDQETEIEQVKLVKDLGIYFSSDMSFDHHIQLTKNKGKQIAGWLLRTFNTRSPPVMLTLLKQLIYPTVEYNSVLWSPTSQELINLLETVQNFFIKKIQSDDLPPDSDYWDRLAHYKLYSLQRRRERYAIIYAWKVIHEIYPNPGLHLNNSTEDHKQHPGFPLRKIRWGGTGLPPHQQT
jgi:hypothetical protein